MQERRHILTKSQAAAPEKRIRETEKNVQEEMWKFIAITLKQGLKRFLESLLEDEVTTKVKARRYERSPRRQGYGGGHYLRDLVTRYGLLDDLRVPRIVGGPVDFQLFNKYERRRSDVDAAIDRLFLQRVSTRKLRGIARELFGQEVRGIGIERKVMLCALGMREDGSKEMLSFRLVDQEDTDSWRAFLVDIKSRGFQGKGLRLITTDGNPGLLKALKGIYPFLKVQRCIAHKLRNVAIKLKRAHLKPCMAEAKDIFNASSCREAIKRFKAWRDKWQVEPPRLRPC